MVLYKCKRCFKEFLKKSHYQQHQNRKIKCKEVLPDKKWSPSNNTSSNLHQCRYCNKEYLHRQSKHKHEKDCREKSNTQENVTLKEENQKLKEENEKLWNKKSGITVDNSITNNNNINIILNVHGKEDLSFIDAEYLKKFTIKHIIEHLPSNRYIPDLTKKTCCSPERIENMNVYLDPDIDENCIFKEDSISIERNGPVMIFSNSKGSDSWNMKNMDRVKLVENMYGKTMSKVREIVPDVVIEEGDEITKEQFENKMESVELDMCGYEKASALESLRINDKNIPWWKDHKMMKKWNNELIASLFDNRDYVKICKNMKFSKN